MALMQQIRTTVVINHEYIQFTSALLELQCRLVWNDCGLDLTLTHVINIFILLLLYIRFHISMHPINIKWIHPSRNHPKIYRISLTDENYLMKIAFQWLHTWFISLLSFQRKQLSIIWVWGNNVHSVKNTNLVIIWGEIHVHSNSQTYFYN